VATWTDTLVLEVGGVVDFETVGEVLKNEALVALEVTTVERLILGSSLSSLLCVTIQYDCMSQGLQSRPTEGFHSWNFSGVTTRERTK
jgi:hypothetical protein